MQPGASGVNYEKYKVRGEFSDLTDFTLKLPHDFDRMGLAIHDSRNVVKKINTPRGIVVVKNFKGMYFFNRLAYSIFRKSKAERSYNYSGILNSKGIITPPHVAWVDCYTLGLLTRSYFVSVYYPYDSLEKILTYNLYERPQKISLFHQLAEFISMLHRLGIYHEDLSMGNILVIPAQDTYKFALVDLNRIRFQKVVSYGKGLKNLATLRLTQQDMNILIREFALLSRQSPEDSIRRFWKYRERRTSLKKIRRTIRKYTVAPLEIMFGK